MKKLTVGFVTALVALSLNAIEAGAFRVENRVGEDGAVVTGREIVGEADGSDFYSWDTTQEEDGWLTLDSFDDDGTSVSADVLVLNDTADVLGGRIGASRSCGPEKPVVVRNETHIGSGATLELAYDTEVRFTDGSELVFEEGAALVSRGVVLTDFSSAYDEIGPDAVIRGVTLVGVDFIDGGTRIGRTHHYTAGVPLGAVPSSPERACATFLGWYAGETLVGVATPVTAGMRQIVAKWKYHEMTVAPASSEVAAVGGELRLTVSANIPWKIDAIDCDWLTVRDGGEGENDGELVFDVAENASTDARAVTVTVSGGGLTRTVIVSQVGMEQLDAPTILPGDGYELTDPYVRVVITPPTTMSDAVIRFTTDGSEPTSESPVFTVFNARDTMTIKARAFKCGYLASASALCRIIRRETLADAMDVPLWKVTTDDDAPWYVVGEGESWDGKSAVRCAPLEDSQDWDVPVTSALRTTIAGAGLLTFRWRVDCEASGLPDEPYDHLALYVDGERVDYLEGDSGWCVGGFEIETPGIHKIEWVYSKDAYWGEGEDAGWIDTVAWTPLAQLEESAENRLERFGVRIPVGASADDMLGSDTDGDGLTLEEELLAGTDPNDAESSLKAFIEIDGDGRPVVTPAPDLSPERDYQIRGKRHLDDASWSDVRPGREGDFNFFRIEMRER